MYDNLVRELQCCPDGEYGCPQCEHRTSLHCRETLMKQAADAIEKLQGQIDGWIEQERKALLKSVPKWIPVTERLPSEELAFYLCYTDAGIVVECLWTNNKFGLGPFGDWGWRLMDVPQYQKVTHWQPRPMPPKEETE